MPYRQSVVQGIGFDKSGAARCRLTMVTPEDKTVGQTIDMMLLALQRDETHRVQFYVSRDPGMIYYQQWRHGMFGNTLALPSQAKGEPKQ